MTSPWPSDRPSQVRASKGPKPKSVVPTDWLSGWLVLLLTVAVPAAVLLILWPLAANALEAIQQITDTLTNTVRNALI